MSNKKVSVYPNYSKSAFLIKGKLPHAGISGTDFNCFIPQFSGNLYSMLYKLFSGSFALMLFINGYIH